MNIPNLLSVFRLVLVPVFAAVYFSPGPNPHQWAAAVYVVAFCTDILDGFLARKLNQITRLGKILDPLADKLMTFTVILCVMLDGVLPLWAPIVLFCKDMIMGLGGFILYRKVGDVITANWWGKASTGVFFVVLALLVLFPIPRDWAVRLISAALLLALCTFIRYTLDFLKLLQKS